MTDTTTTETTLTGRALWDANPRSYATLLHDRTAFAYAVNSELSADEHMVLDPAVTEQRTRFEESKQAFLDWLAHAGVDPEVKRRFEEVEETVYGFAGESFTAGLEFAAVAEQFRVGLLALGSAEK